MGSVSATKVASGVLMALGVASAAPSPATPRPVSVLLISIDTLRPDALGWVAGRNATPAIDALAREGFRFPAAVSPVPLTLPAHASLMSGLLPRRHGVRDNGQVLGTGPRLLAETLRERGYETAAFVSGYPLRAPFGLARGFDVFDDAIPSRADAWTERPASDTTSAAVAWLHQRPPDRRPFFLFVHYYDPHDPYEPPARLKGSGTRGAYDGEVRSVDESIADLRRAVGGRVPDSLLTVLTSDHGESLGEHGEETHGFFVYDSTVLVPLVFHAPQLVKPGESRAPARLVDVVPTLLDLLGLPRLPDADGVSLRPTMSGERQDVPPAYVESQQPWLGYGWAPLRGLRTSTVKLILAPRVELYDLAQDPGEQVNLASQRGKDVERLAGLVREAESRPASGASGAADAASLERLRSLGYVGGAVEPGSEPPAGLPDPKDRLALKAQLAEAEAAVQAKDHAGALSRFDAVLALEPDSRFALMRSAKALVELRRPAEAVVRLERLVRLDPTLGEARYQLADALTRAGDRRRAIEQWSETVRLHPARAVAWSNLGAVLTQSGQLLRAVEAFERALELEPKNAQFAENLGTCRYELALRDLAAGRTEAARTRLAAALSAAPSLRRKAAADPRLKPLLPP